MRERSPTPPPRVIYKDSKSDKRIFFLAWFRATTAWLYIVTNAGLKMLKIANELLFIKYFSNWNSCSKRANSTTKSYL